MGKVKTLCLVGNPNSGKTTIFNLLTGGNQKVGNWTGVTVEEKVGQYKKDKNVKIVDLPGLYSLNSTAIDEKVLLSYLKENKVDLIINVVDGTNIKRSLLLTKEITSLKIPMVIAVNFLDELEKNKAETDFGYLSALFNCPVIGVSGKTGKNVEKLLSFGDLPLPNNLNKTDSARFLGKLNTENLHKEFISQKITKKIDAVILDKFLAYPVFFVIITLVYFTSIKLGSFFGEKIVNVFNDFQVLTQKNLSQIFPKVFISFLCNGVIKGLGTVFSFFPQIIILFFFLAIIEETGYASRIAYLADVIMSKIGLNGKSFIPLTICLGCTVSGVLATKTVSGRRERERTIILSNYVPCSAKSAVFGWISGVMFNSAVVASSMYFLSLIFVVVVGKVLKKFSKLGGEVQPFILEMPPYRAPTVKDIFIALKNKTLDFLLKAGSSIFLISIVIWFLSYFGLHGYTENVSESFIYFVGSGLRYLFIPLGFGSWQVSVSLISGIFAKEGIIESLVILSNDLPSLFDSEFSVYAFMSLILLLPPCLSSLSTIKSQLSNRKTFVIMIVSETVFAYFTALTINLIGIIFKNNINLIFPVFVGIIILTTFVLTVTKALKVNYCEKEGCLGCKIKSKRNLTI